MKKLLWWIMGKKDKKKRVIQKGGEWMRDEIREMIKMNQGVISMSLGRE